MTVFRDDAEVDRWLAGQHQGFLRSLETRIDLDAGLREVQLPDRHTEMSDALNARLDIEAGLAAILPCPASSVPVVAEDAFWPLGSPQWAARQLDMMSLPARLLIRAAYASKLGILARKARNFSLLPRTEQVNADGSSVTDLRQDERLVAAWDEFNALFPQQTGYLVDQNRHTMLMYEYRKLDKDPDLPDCDRDSRADRTGSARELLGEREEAQTADGEAPNGEIPVGTSDFQDPAQRNTFALEFGEQDIEYAIVPFSYIETARATTIEAATWWIDAVRMYVGLEMLFDPQKHRAGSGRAAAADPAAVILVEFADELENLEKQLNDFVGADLSGVELNGVPLDGLRWSAVSTRWPQEWQERIERVSIQVDDDIFEVHHGTHTDQSALV